MERHIRYCLPSLLVDWEGIKSISSQNNGNKIFRILECSAMKLCTYDRTSGTSVSHQIFALLWKDTDSNFSNFWFNYPHFVAVVTGRIQFFILFWTKGLFLCEWWLEVSLSSFPHGLLKHINEYLLIMKNIAEPSEERVLPWLKPDDYSQKTHIGCAKIPDQR